MATNNGDVHRRHSDIPQDALFDAEPVPVRRRNRKTIPAVAHAACPVCGAENVAQVLDGAARVWRLHFRTTRSGTQFVCAATGTAVGE